MTNITFFRVYRIKTKYTFHFIVFENLVLVLYYVVKIENILLPVRSEQIHFKILNTRLPAGDKSYDLILHYYGQSSEGD